MLGLSCMDIIKFHNVGEARAGVTRVSCDDMCMCGGSVVVMVMFEFGVNPVMRWLHLMSMWTNGLDRNVMLCLKL